MSRTVFKRMGSQPKIISILMASRSRPDLAKKCLSTLIERASDPSCMEAILRIDWDDPVGHEYVPALEGISKQIDLSIIGGQGKGYAYLHDYYGECAREASGEFLFITNDDMIMMTPKWDKIVKKYAGQRVLLKPSTNHPQTFLNVFPIVHREIYKIVGFNIHLDTWLETICRPIGVEREIPVHIIHDRFDLTGQNKDEIFDTRIYLQEKFWSNDMVQLRAQLSAELDQYLHGGGNKKYRKADRISMAAQIKRLLAEGMTLLHASREVGIHVKTAQRWLNMKRREE